jgi:ribonuclease T2
MIRLTNRTFVAILFSAAAALPLTANMAAAQDARQNQPGKFDFYVLSLSWSPSYCDAAAERAPDQPPPPECGSRTRPFVVHGLWPQYDTGYPEFCQQPAPKLDRNAVSSMLDLMPAPQ